MQIFISTHHHNSHKARRETKSKVKLEREFFVSFSLGFSYEEFSGSSVLCCFSRKEFSVIRLFSFIKDAKRREIDTNLFSCHKIRRVLSGQLIELLIEFMLIRYDISCNPRDIFCDEGLSVE